MHICAHVYTDMCIGTQCTHDAYMHRQTHIHTPIHVCTHEYTRTHTCLCTHARAHIHTRVHVCTHTYVCICTYKCTHITILLSSPPKRSCSYDLPKVTPLSRDATGPALRDALRHSLREKQCFFRSPLQRLCKPISLVYSPFWIVHPLIYLNTFESISILCHHLG